MKRALITGGGGFIGRRLVALAAKMGFEVVAPLRTDLDLLNAAATQAEISRLAPNLVFHLAAAGVSPERAGGERCVIENISLTANLLNALADGTRVIVAGSMSEYGRSGRLQESDPLKPHTPYGRAKAACTTLALAQRPRLEIAVTRLFGVYGPGEQRPRLFPTLVADLPRGLAVDLSDPTQLRDFVYVDDVCEVLLAIACLPQLSFDVVNVGTGHAVTLEHACRRVAETLRSDPMLLRFGRRPLKPGDEPVMEANTTRLHSLIGWVPKQHFNAAVLPALS